MDSVTSGVTTAAGGAETLGAGATTDVVVVAAMVVAVVDVADAELVSPEPHPASTPITTALTPTAVDRTRTLFEEMTAT